MGAVLATVGGRPSPASGSAAGDGLPTARPAAADTTGAVVPVLGGNADGGGLPIAVPVANVAAIASASATTAAGRPRPAPVAPLRGLRQADLLVVAPFSLSGRVLAAVSRQQGVTSADPLEAAKIKINGAYTAVLGVDPSTFRAYAAGPTAAATSLWQGVADGGVAVSYTMGTLDRLRLGREVTAAGRRGTAAGGRVRHRRHRRGGRRGVRLDRQVAGRAGRQRHRHQRTALERGVACRADQAAPATRRGGRAAGHAGDQGVRGHDPSRFRHRRRGRGRRAHGYGPAAHGPARRGERSWPAVRVGRRGPGVVRLLGPSPVGLRPGGRQHAPGGRRPGHDRSGRAGQPTRSPATCSSTTPIRRIPATSPTLPSTWATAG